MKRISILASGAAFSLFAALVAQGCSSAEDDPDPVIGQGGTGGQVGGGQGGTGTPAAGAGGTASPGAGGTASPGTGGSPAGGQGGTPAAAGQGGTPAAGAGGTGTGGAGGAPGAPTTCVGSVTNNSACTVTCIDPCGVFNLGTRLCTCTNAIAACVTCEFAVEDPLLTPPTAAFPACVGLDAMPATDDVMEDLDQGVAYTCVADTRCEPLGEPDRFCGCRDNEWDCDSKPDSFTF